MVTVALSSLSPLELRYGLDSNIELNAQTIYFSDGLTINNAQILNECVDLVINKDNLLILTTPLRLQDVAEVIDDDELLLEDYIGSTTIELSSGGFWDTNQGVLGTTDDVLIQTEDLFFILFSTSTTVSATNDSIVFFVNFEDSLISIHDTFDQYLTFDPSTLGMSFSAQIVPDTDNYQHFSYILDGNQIVLITAVPWLSPQRTVEYNTAAGLLSTCPAISPSYPITSNKVFILGDFRESGLNDFDALQSNWVVYDRKDQSLDINSDKSITGTRHNLLLSAPYKTLSGNILDVNINNLKNYQTPEYGYIRDGDLPYGREYDKIIAGTNQEGGYENLFMTFNGETQELPLEKDKYTYFHFAPTAASHGLSASTLINSGAIAGNTPWRSDKVFKKQADYGRYSNWGDANKQDGMWFCAWLSGSENPEVAPIWMDRFFDPTYASVSATTLQYALLSAIENDLVTDIGNPVIWDIPSTLLFEPGVLYIYHHVGETRNAEIVSNLKLYTGLLLDFTQWGSEDSSTIVDGSTNESNGQVFGFTLSANQATLANITNPCYNVNGTYGYVEKIDSVFANNELTLSFIIHADDWSNIVGNQILGNYFNGGIGLFNNNPILTPYITLTDSTNGYVFHLNTDFGVINRSIFVPHLNSRSRVIAKTNYDEEYYILDSNQKILTYDIENVLQNVVTLTSLVSGISATQFEVDGDYNFHLFDKVASKYYKVSTAGAMLTSHSVTATDSFALDFDGTPHFPIVTGVKGATINTNGDFYYITNNYLYRNDIVVWQASAIEGILCDDADNIWLTYGTNKLAKLDTVNSLVFSVTTPITSNSVGSRSLSFHKELTPIGINEFVLVFDSRTQYGHKLSTDGIFTASTPTSAFTGSLVALSGLTLHGNDNNGFEFQRKYVVPNVITPGISVKAFLREQFINGTSQKIRLQVDTSEYFGTKHFAIVFNYAQGTIKLYIDGDLVASDTFDPFKFKIAANTNVLSLAFGTDSSKRDVLVNDLEQPGFYTFDGIIGDFRAFSTALNSWDIAALMNYSKTKAYDTLVWNMPVGSRNYVEEVERFFKHKMPGNKSQFFNIRLSGLNITDTAVRTQIEESIKSVLTRISPVHATLYQIIWE